MSIRTVCKGFATARTPRNNSMKTTVSTMCTARSISEANHEKVLRYVFRKRAKALNSKLFIESESPRLEELQQLILIERGFELSDVPGCKNLELYKYLDTETIRVQFDPKNAHFDVRISKTKEGVESIPYYFEFRYTKFKSIQIGGRYYSYELDSGGGRRNFAPRYNGIPEFILMDAQKYLTDRGIDARLAEFLRLEGECKLMREDAASMKGLISFLKKKNETAEN